MEELKKFTGQAMNLDKNDKSLLPTETREVYNSITDRKGVFTRIEGNTLVNFTLPAGDNKVIGWCNDYSRHAIIYFVKNSLGNHCILRVRGNKIDKVLWVQPVLNFKGRINHANVIGDLLYWTDGHFESSTDYNPPRKINMIRAIGGNYTFLSTFAYEKHDVVYWDGKVYEFIGDNSGVFPLSDTDNWKLKGRVYDNLTTERLYWILDRIKYPRSAEAPVVYYSDNVPAVDPPVIIDPPTLIPYGYLYNWDALFELTFDTFNYGLLYNWYAATDVRNICADGWEIPSNAQWDTLRTYLGGTSFAGGKLKETGLVYWGSPNTGATNETGFNARGAGVRQGTDGTFDSIITSGVWFSSDSPTLGRCGCASASNSASLFNSFPPKDQGCSMRPIKTTTTLTHGQTGTYIGNDGKVYRTICIGTQEWLADNLAETKFRDGSWIPGYDGGVYTPISNAAYAALTTAWVSAYNDDLNNV